MILPDSDGTLFQINPHLLMNDIRTLLTNPQNAAELLLGRRKHQTLVPYTPPHTTTITTLPAAKVITHEPTVTPTLPAATTTPQPVNTLAPAPIESHQKYWRPAPDWRTDFKHWIATEERNGWPITPSLNHLA
jgi:hypothetical protein